MFGRRTRVLFVDLGAASAPTTITRPSVVDVVRDIREAAERLSSERYSLIVLSRDPGNAGRELLASRGQAKVPILVLGGAEDATADGALPELHQVLDLLPEYAYIRDADGAIRYANARFRETFGAPEGRTCFELLRGRESPCDGCHSLSTVQAGEPWIWENAGGRMFEVRHLAFVSRDGERRVLEIGVDITEERTSRAAMEAARDVVESLPIGILTFRFAPPDQLVLFDANVAALKVVRGTRAEWLGRPFEDLWPPEMVVKAKGALLEVARGGEPYEGEVTLRRGADVRRAFRVRAFRLGVDRVVAAFEDTTEETRAKEALAQSEETQRSILRASPVGIGLVRDRAFAWVNDTLCEMLGYSAEELVGCGARVIYPDDAEFERVGRVTNAAIAKTGVGRMETRWQTKGGERLEIDLQSAPVDARDLSRGVIITALDITARRKTEMELERARRDMALVLDATDETITYHDLDFRIVWANRAAAASVGLRVDEMIGRRCYELWHGSDRRCESCPSVLAWETGLVREADDTTPDGRTRRLRAYPVMEGGRVVGVVEYGQDITAKKLAEQDLRRLEAQLRQAQRLESIGTLASGIAHEINNPLMGMINYAALIAERVGDETLRGFAEGVKEEGARVAGIVRSLLSFARGGREPLRSARPADVVESALGLVRALLVKDGVEIDVRVPEGLPPIHCRPHELQQVLLNLLTNARDALNERYPTGSNPAKRLRILGEDAGLGRVRLTVEDEGAGVAADHLERVFEPFFTTKPRDRGTGLGLSVSYGIVRDHGGTLTIDSRTGGPTRLHVEIPASSEEGDP